MSNETTKMLKGMAYKARLKGEKHICMTLACQTLKKKHGLQVFETCKLEEKQFFV